MQNVMKNKSDKIIPIKNSSSRRSIKVRDKAKSNDKIKLTKSNKNMKNVSLKKTINKATTLSDKMLKTNVMESHLDQSINASMDYDTNTFSDRSSSLSEQSMFDALDDNEFYDKVQSPQSECTANINANVLTSKKTFKTKEYSEPIFSSGKTKSRNLILINDNECLDDDDNDEEDEDDENSMENFHKIMSDNKEILKKSETLNASYTPTKYSIHRPHLKISPSRGNNTQQTIVTENDYFNVSSINAIKMDVGDVINDKLFKRLNANMKPMMIEHNCNQQCAKISINLPINERTLNCFLKPYYYGFTRFNVIDGDKKNIIYRSPCNKVLENYYEVQSCLKMLKLKKLDISNFTFSPQLEFIGCRQAVYAYVPDISGGLEAHPIPYYNFIDDVSFPPNKGVYITKNIFDQSVQQYLPNLKNKHNLIIRSCNCNKDGNDCVSINSGKCICRDLNRNCLLSFEEEKQYLNCLENENDVMLKKELETKTYKTFPYSHKLLQWVEDDGIFECGDLCKCNQRCPTRVVGNGLKVNLAVTRIPGKGFGIKAMQFIPRGTFVGTYAGVWYDSKKIPKNLKDSNYSLVVPYSKNFELQSRMLGIANPKTFTLNNEMIGNFGKYFNHSCVPNIFIQKVFLNNDDQRFPTMAFFTSRDVNFGEELCWDYNSEEMLSKFYCLCGNKYCKGVPPGVSLPTRTKKFIIQSEMESMFNLDANVQDIIIDPLMMKHLQRLLYQFNNILIGRTFDKNIDEKNLPSFEDILNKAAKNYLLKLDELNLPEVIQIENVKHALKNPNNLNDCLRLIGKECFKCFENVDDEHHQQSQINEQQDDDNDDDGDDNDNVYIDCNEDIAKKKLRRRLLDQLFPLLLSHYNGKHLIKPGHSINLQTIVEHFRKVTSHFDGDLDIANYSDNELFSILNNPYSLYQILHLIGVHVPMNIIPQIELFKALGDDEHYQRVQQHINNANECHDNVQQIIQNTNGPQSHQGFKKERQTNRKFLGRQR